MKEESGNPDFPARLALAMSHHRAGRLTESGEIYRQILAAEPCHADALHLLGVVAHQIGRPTDAIGLIGRAIALKNDAASYYANLGNVLKDLRRRSGAVASYRAALILAPVDREIHFNLAVGLQELGQPIEAIAAYRAALRILPSYIEALTNLGNLFKDLGRPDEARAAHRLTISLQPDVAPPYSNLGVALKDLGRFSDAADAQRIALRILPEFAAAHSNLGISLNPLGHHREAVAAYRSGLSLNPELAATYYNLGNALRDLDRVDEGISAYDTALRLKPDYVEAHTNRGNALKDLGRVDTAVAAYEAALYHNPDFVEAHSNLLMTLHYRETGSAAILATARRFAARFETGAMPSFTRSLAPDRRLRIGYVSADFKRHPVGYFLSRVFPSQDRTAMKIFCYSNSDHEDDLTLRLRSNADHWRGLVGLSDTAAAALITADQIDILVDLSGHTAGNRLPMFALKPAPLQLTWLGYWGTTGLSSMDYILSDAVTIPPGEEVFYSERVLRLPQGRFCYDPPDYAPLPDRRTGPVTFGSFNNMTKVGPDVVRLWARVLKAVPGSRLILKWQSLADETLRHRVRESFAAQGIDADRLDLRGASPHAAMLGEYADIDVALDPFPFSGGLTSCEALWMGVPVVTLRGTSAPARQTEGFLKTLGLADWIAATQDDYVRIAATLAEDRHAVRHWRAELRPLMAASPLCDGPAFAKALEAAFRQIWQEKCGENAAADLAPLLANSLRHHQSGNLAAAEGFYRKILAVEPRHADAQHLLGVIAHQVGRHDAAIDLIGKAIAINGSAPAYHSNLGLALDKLGRLTDAVSAYRTALHIKPDLGDTYSNLGLTLKDLGRVVEAVAAYKAALCVTPDFAEAYSNLGIAQKALGRREEAIAAYDTASRVKPDFADAHSNQSVSLKELGRLDEAVAACNAAIRIKPDYAEAHSNRGNALKELRRLEEAITAFRATLALKPDYAAPYSNMGATLHDLGRLTEAVAVYDIALRIRPDYAEAHYNRGNTLKELGRVGDAIAAYGTALHFRPELEAAHYNLGNALGADDAIAAYDTALRLKPNYVEAHTNRGNALKDLGRVDEAVAAYEAALTHKPDFAEAHSNLLMTLHYRETGNAAILAAARRFAACFEIGATPSFTRSHTSDRRLRIGYVSADFKRHPVGYFLRRVLPSHDRTAMEIFCYSNSPTEDDVTARLRSTVDQWRTVAGKSDQAAAALITADQIDILVDLSGHTAGNRLPMFALKPAPLQLTWLGYWGTTGLSSMDYILSDAVTIPPGEEVFYSERVLRLPQGRFCYDPPDYAPLPDRRTGPVTFGSFNNMTKVGPDVVRLWARVLKAVPGSRLILKWQSLADETLRHRVRESFAAQGIDADRLDLRGASPHAAMLGEYADIDVALDPFPFSGGLTSCEALWMGVPVVTLRGTSAPARQTEGFLRTLGLVDWIAATQDDYVRIATALAQDRHAVRHWRAELRPLMAASPLCDGPAFAKALEAQFRQIWQH